MSGPSTLPPRQPVLREIVEEQTFAEQVKVITPDIRRFDEIMSGVTWALARKPEDFSVADEISGLRVVKTDSWNGSPGLRIFFKFDDVQTRLCWVESISPDEIEDRFAD